MLKIYCLITGNDYNIVVNESPKSKYKIALLANAILLPVIIWTINGYLLSSKVFESSTTLAFVVGLVCAVIIFIIERIIVMSTTNRTTKWFRVILGFCVALIGALALDEVLFKEDIDYQINQNRNDFVSAQGKQEEKRFDSLHAIPTILASIEIGRTEANFAEEKATAEMDGKGSGIRGLGKIARKKLEIAADRNLKLQKQESLLDSLLNRKAAAVTKAEQKAREEYRAGLIVRVGALFQLIGNNLVMCLSYCAFTIIAFCLEFIVVIVKLKTPETSYEKKLKLIEEIADRRIEILRGGNSPFNDPGKWLPSAISARQALNKDMGIFN